jgi:cytochrome d ubiquinol oxidase subunit I
MTFLAAIEPPQLLAAREQMAFTLAFHIILVPFGVAFTSLMSVLNYRGIRRGDDAALTLAERWSKVAAVLFAVGAVSGTVLSFEMGLLWPGLMGRFGAAYGIPFAVEGLFFFLEAIFLAIYIYGWKRMRPWPHFFAGVPVTLAGIGGTACVVAANGWMNLPGGVTLRDGAVVGVRPLAVFFNRAFLFQSVHMLLAAYIVAGFVVAGVYAAALLRGRRDHYHHLGFVVPFTVAAVLVPAQIVVGHWAAHEDFKNEPAKFAAIEILPRTGGNVPETIGGVLVDGKVRYGIRIPGLASFLTDYHRDTPIRGLDSIPAAVRPNPRLVSVVHLAFDVMVFTALLLLALAGWFGFGWWRRRTLPRSRWFLRGAAVSGVLSIISLESGWVVTEVGRQPWTVNGLLLTREAVTPAAAPRTLWLVLAATVVVYSGVGTATILVLRSMRRRWAAGEDLGVPYGPEAPLEAALPETIRA